MMGVWTESPPPVSEGVCALPKVEGIVKNSGADRSVYWSVGTLNKNSESFLRKVTAEPSDFPALSHKSCRTSFWTPLWIFFGHFLDLFSDVPQAVVSP